MTIFAYVVLIFHTAVMVFWNLAGNWYQRRVICRNSRANAGIHSIWLNSRVFGRFFNHHQRHSIYCDASGNSMLPYHRAHGGKCWERSNHCRMNSEYFSYPCYGKKVSRKYLLEIYWSGIHWDALSKYLFGLFLIDSMKPVTQLWTVTRTTIWVKWTMWEPKLLRTAEANGWCLCYREITRAPSAGKPSIPKKISATIWHKERLFQSNHSSSISVDAETFLSDYRFSLIQGGLPVWNKNEWWTEEEKFFEKWESQDQ